jgi:regulatory protein PHO2
MLDTRSKPMALHLDPHGFVASLDDEHPPSPSTPGSTIQSPSSPARPRPRSAHGTPDTRGPDTLKVPASGPQRARSTTAGSAKTEKEKRKRSRVNPEQLIHLERFFALDRSPTAARRREISDLLGMQERQTQIWFQNRSVIQVIASLEPMTMEVDERRPNYRTERTKVEAAARSLPLTAHPNCRRVLK